MTLQGIVIGGTAGTGSVGVPDVVGRPQAEAEAKLRQFGLVPQIQVIEADGDEGTVFSQDPAARTIRAPGTVVTLLVVKTPLVPPNLGQQLADLQTSVNSVSAKVDDVSAKIDKLTGDVEAEADDDDTPAEP
jgi:serine/threonine-protein kinase